MGAQTDPAALALHLDSARAIAPLLFVGLYALATLLFIPGAVLTIADGALFRTVYNMAGASLGALAAFLIARHVAWSAVRARLEVVAGGRVEHLLAGVEAEGWRFVAFVRLVPLFPFNVLNYALGLTRIRTVGYTLATFVFMLPDAAAYTWLGYAGRAAASLFSRQSQRNHRGTISRHDTVYEQLLRLPNCHDIHCLR